MGLLEAGCLGDPAWDDERAETVYIYQTTCVTWP